jgi:hypothetical protein
VHTSPTSDGPRDAGQLVWERDGGNVRMDTRFERREPGRQPMFRPVQPAHDTARAEDRQLSHIAITSAPDAQKTRLAARAELSWH